MSKLIVPSCEIFVPTRNIWVPRRGLQWKGNEGFISKGLLGAVAASGRRRTSGGYTLLYDCITGVAGTGNVAGYTTNFYYFGGVVVDSQARSIGKITFKLKAIGDISGKAYLCKLWSVSGGPTGSLNALLATSDPVTGVNAWNADSVPFTFVTPYSTPNTWAFTIDPSGVAADVSNYTQIYYSAAGNFSTPYPSSAFAGAVWWNTVFNHYNEGGNTEVAEVMIYTSP